MKALKSELARKILSDKEAVDDLRAALEFSLSSKSKNSNKSSPVITYRDKDGTRKRVRLEVVSLT